MSQEITRDDILKFLQSHYKGVLGVSAQNEEYPHLSVLYYVISDEGNLYFLTRKDTHKIQQIEKHGHASFLVFAEEPPVTVRLWGAARIVHNPEEIFKPMFDKLTAVHGESPAWPTPVAKLYGEGSLVLVEIATKAFSYADFSDEAPERIQMSNEA